MSTLIFEIVNKIKDGNLNKMEALEALKNLNNLQK